MLEWLLHFLPWTLVSKLSRVMPHYRGGCGFFTQHLVLCELLRVWSSKSKFIIGLGPVLGLKKKLRWSISLLTLDCGGKVLPPQLSPRNLVLKSSLVTFHTKKVLVVDHSNQSAGRNCGWCSMSSISQSISGSDLGPKKKL